MSRINIRYYRAHPPVKERELSPAVYILWHGMTREQQEKFKTWAKKMNKAMLNFTDRAAAALLPLAEKIGQIMQNYEAPTMKMSKDRLDAVEKQIDALSEEIRRMK